MYTYVLRHVKVAALYVSIDVYVWWLEIYPWLV